MGMQKAISIILLILSTIAIVYCLIFNVEARRYVH